MLRLNLRLTGCLGQKPALEGLKPGSRPEPLKPRLKQCLSLHLFDSLAKWVAFEQGVSNGRLVFAFGVRLVAH